jgi:hypothetical protein
MKASITIEGVEILVPELEFLHTKLGRQLARVVLKAGLNVIGKQMKKDLDPRVKEAGNAVEIVSRFTGRTSRGQRSDSTSARMRGRCRSDASEHHAAESVSVRRMCTGSLQALASVCDTAIRALRLIRGNR